MKAFERSIAHSSMLFYKTKISTVLQTFRCTAFLVMHDVAWVRHQNYGSSKSHVAFGDGLCQVLVKIRHAADGFGRKCVCIVRMDQRFGFSSVKLNIFLAFVEHDAMCCKAGSCITTV